MHILIYSECNRVYSVVLDSVKSIVLLCIVVYLKSQREMNILFCHLCVKSKRTI